jgi:hypothetical protein
MPVSKEFNSKFNAERVNEVYEKFINLLQEKKLTVAELCILLGNTLYTVGASIEGFKDEGPDMEELNKRYYTKPTVGIAIMLNGMTLVSYFDDLNKVEAKKKEDGEIETKEK